MTKKTSLLEDPIFQTLVAAIAATIAKLTNLKTAGFYQEAQDEIDRGLEDLIGLKTDQIRNLSDSFVLDLLTVNEFLDLERLWFVAELIHAEGEIQIAQGRLSEGLESQTRALGFFIEVAFSANEDIPQVTQRIDALFSAWVDDLPAETLYSLYDYFDQRGDYIKAEKVITRMSTVTGNDPEIVGEMRDFYHRLVEKTDEELEQGGLIRTQVENASARIG
jgi:hypothetical protein